MHGDHDGIYADVTRGLDSWSGKVWFRRPPSEPVYDAVLDQGPYREAAQTDPRVESRRAELCKPLANAVTRMVIYAGMVAAGSLAALALEQRFAPVIVAATFVLVPTFAGVLRSRYIALRFMRDTVPLVAFVDEGGLVLLSPEGLSREGKQHVAFVPRAGRDGSLARVVHDVEKHSLTMVVLWKPPQKRKAMEEREHRVPLPPSISPTQAAMAGQQLATLRGCALVTGSG